FLSYMHEKDPARSYTAKYVDRNFRGLNKSIEKLIYELKESRVDIEVQAHYLKAILDNVSTGIIAFKSSGVLESFNGAAHKLLGTAEMSYLKELDDIIPGLTSRLLGLKPGEQFSEAIKKNGRSTHLIVSKSTIKLKSETIHIVSLNDISNQMEEQEIQSWKKLIRVINHEIMNSMTPIITLAMAIRKKLTTGTPDATEDAVLSATIIEERSKGLVNFIERYKKLTGLPPLKPETFQVGELFRKIEDLYKEDMKKQSILLNCQSDCSHELEADRYMLEQVLINLVKNSLKAVQKSKNPEISISCSVDHDSRVSISVRDNGEGIHQDKLEQVFVPFFTTREDGSGIGLSLCKQIIQFHNGRIDMVSSPGKGTTVTFRL
ncbi:MAG: HAMP domain-containing sensor histidine kinase, partial [Bacteroides sp.]|nr:HAMP domain-containing sensor histidine kinase [Bacteroides sp.]